MIWWHAWRMTWKNPKTRLDAIEHLAESGRPSAVVPLIRHSYNENGYLVKAADEAVQRLGANAVTPLLQLLESTEEVRGIRGRAMKLLGAIGAVECVRPMLIANADNSFMHTVPNALRTLGVGATTELLKFALDTQHPNASRRQAIERLAEIGDAKIASNLLPLLAAEPNSELAPVIVRTLGELKSQAAVPALLEMFESSDASQTLRQATIVALGELGCRDVVPRCIRQLTTAAHRDSASRTLAAMPDPRAFTPLVEVLEQLTRRLSKNQSFTENYNLLTSAELARNALSAILKAESHNLTTAQLKRVATLTDISIDIDTDPLTEQIAESACVAIVTELSIYLDGIARMARETLQTRTGH